MLALGRALMSHPSLLMLDEPSLGLAPLIVKEILTIVSELRSAGVSILLIEQNARAALQIADYGYVLENGEVALEGPSHDLAMQSAGHQKLSGLGRMLACDCRSSNFLMRHSAKGSPCRNRLSLFSACRDRILGSRKAALQTNGRNEPCLTEGYHQQTGGNTMKRSAVIICAFLLFAACTWAASARNYHWR